MHFPTFLLIATLSVALPLASFAADCSGNGGGNGGGNRGGNRGGNGGGNRGGQCGSYLASRNQQYAARQLFCGNNLWRTTSCFVDGEVKITLNRPGANNQQVCWDALEDIINQCGQSSLRGVYNYNGAQYMLTRCVDDDGRC